MAVRRHIMALGVKGSIDFRNIDTSEAARESLIEIAGSTVVPCLQHEGQIVLGAEAIVTFLDEWYGQKS